MNGVLTPESVLVIVRYENEFGEIFIPLTKSNKWKIPFWRIIGGGVDTQEHPIAAAARETAEETNLRVINLRQIDIIKKASRLKKWKKHNQYVFIGETISIEGMYQTIKDGDETLTNKLFPLKEIMTSLSGGCLLDGYALLPKHAITFRKALEKQLL